MKLYDDLIAEVRATLDVPGARHYATGSVPPWRDEGENRVLLAKECAFELGGGGRGHGACLVTRDAELMGESGVTVVGRDLSQLDGDAPFCRITLALTDAIDDGSDTAYKSVQKVDFVKYHVFPEGYMLRISSEGSREQVRVGKRAVKQGITFAAVGELYARKYLENADIRAVHTYFVTDADAAEKLKKVADEAKRRTAALNKILKTVMLDCSVCSLKPVCDEVEELKELHFGRNEAAKQQGENK